MLRLVPLVADIDAAKADKLALMLCALGVRASTDGSGAGPFGEWSPSWATVFVPVSDLELARWGYSLDSSNPHG